MADSYFNLHLRNKSGSQESSGRLGTFKPELKSDSKNNDILDPKFRTDVNKYPFFLKIRYYFILLESGIHHKT
jgi:hypothetical protein